MLTLRFFFLSAVGSQLTLVLSLIFTGDAVEASFAFSTSESRRRTDL